MLLLDQWAHLICKVRVVAHRLQHWVRPLMSFLPQQPAEYLPALGKLASWVEVSWLVQDQFPYVLQPKSVGSPAWPSCHLVMMVYQYFYLKRFESTSPMPVTEDFEHSLVAVYYLFFSSSESGLSLPKYVTPYTYHCSLSSSYICDWGEGISSKRPKDTCSIFVKRDTLGVGEKSRCVCYTNLSSQHSGDWDKGERRGKEGPQLAVKSDDPSLIPGAHVVEEDSWTLHVAHWPPRSRCGICPPVLTTFSQVNKWQVNEIFLKDLGGCFVCLPACLFGDRVSLCSLTCPRPL